MRAVSRRRLLAGSMVAPFARVIPSPPNGARAAEASAADIPTYRGSPARTGENPGPGPLGSPVIRWWIRLGEMVSSSPVVVDGTIYVGSAAPTTLDGGALHAVDAASGIERWRRGTAPGDALFCTPTVADGIVVTGSYDGIMIAVSTETGEEQWRFQAAGHFYTPSPALVDGTVYLGNADGYLYAIDVETGEERWHYAARRGDARSISTPAVADGVVYVVDQSFWADDPTYLHAFDAATGEERWRFEPDSGEHVYRIPMLADGRVHVLTREQGLYTLDPGSGDVQSELDLGVSSACPPALAGDVLYIGTDVGELIAVSLVSGEREWSVDLEEGVPITSSPTVAGRRVYAGDGAGTVYAVDRESGEARWDLFTGCLLSTAAVTGGTLYIGANTGLLVAIGGAQIEGPDRENRG